MWRGVLMYYGCAFVLFVRLCVSLCVYLVSLIVNDQSWTTSQCSVSTPDTFTLGHDGTKSCHTTQLIYKRLTFKKKLLITTVDLTYLTLDSPVVQLLTYHF